jgi:hypothetical protein
LAARAEAVASVIEAHDLLDPLDADIERAIGFRERLGVVPAARGQRPSGPSIGAISASAMPVGLPF